MLSLVEQFCLEPVYIPELILIKYELLIEGVLFERVLFYISV